MFINNRLAYTQLYSYIFRLIKCVVNKMHLCSGNRHPLTETTNVNKSKVFCSRWALFDKVRHEGLLYKLALTRLYLIDRIFRMGRDFDLVFIDVLSKAPSQLAFFKDMYSGLFYTSCIQITCLAILESPCSFSLIKRCSVIASFSCCRRPVEHSSAWHNSLA